MSRVPFRTCNDAIFDALVPFVVTPKIHLPSLDLAPFGVPIEHHVDPLAMRSETFLTILERLDAMTFGPEGMPMPRWVFFDCAELPACIVGFGQKARDLPQGARDILGVPAGYEDLVPLSMYIALPMYEPGIWFGHNLASMAPVLAERVKEGRDLHGLGSITKSYGLKAMQARRLYGATQWASTALFIHTKFGPLALDTAYTPAHSELETLTYWFDVDDRALRATMGDTSIEIERPAPDFWLSSHDIPGMQALQARIEAGERFVIPQAPRRMGDGNEVPVTRVGSTKEARP
jgi:hypothetical protein